MEFNVKNTPSKKELRRLKKEADDQLFEYLDQFAAEEQSHQTVQVSEHNEQKEKPQIDEQKTAPVPPMEEIVTKSLNILLENGARLFSLYKDIIKKDESFLKLKDQEKLERFRNIDKTFMEEFPIVGRYMVCTGTYSPTAFRRFLLKIRNVVHPGPEKRGKGYMEDQWVRRQCDYVRYLWEDNQKGHYNNAEAKFVWSETYKLLTKEFSDFRDKFKSVEEKVKENKVKYNISRTKELLERIAGGEQSLNEEDSKDLLGMCKLALRKKQYQDMLMDLVSKTKLIPPVCVGYGEGPSDNVKMPTVKMIEHVDEARMGEIPSMYKDYTPEA
jgi:hypothetical protein